MAGPDPSAGIASRLAASGPTDLPALEELEHLLQKPLPERAPITAGAHRLLRQSADAFVLDKAAGSLAIAVRNAVSPALAGIKQSTSSYVDCVLIRPLLALDSLQPLQSRIDFEPQRDSVDSASKMAPLKAAFGDRLRPDLMLREASSGRLLMKGQERGSGEFTLADAVADLTATTGCWSEYYYGHLDYLLSYAAAGRYLQLFALRRGSPVTAVSISPVYDLANLDDRAAAVLASFNLYTLLAAVHRSLPRYVLPAGKELTVEHPDGFTRTVYAPLHTQCPLVVSIVFEGSSLVPCLVLLDSRHQ